MVMQAGHLQFLGKLGGWLLCQRALGSRLRLGGTLCSQLMLCAMLDMMLDPMLWAVRCLLCTTALGSSSSVRLPVRLCGNQGAKLRTRFGRRWCQRLCGCCLDSSSVILGDSLLPANLPWLHVAKLPRANRNMLQGC
jgi:hypothetical protein